MSVIVETNRYTNGDVKNFTLVFDNVTVEVAGVEAMLIHDELGKGLKCAIDDCPCYARAIQCTKTDAQQNFELGFEHAVETVRDWYEPEPPERN